jgi:hypothetical protein
MPASFRQSARWEGKAKKIIAKVVCCIASLVLQDYAQTLVSGGAICTMKQLGDNTSNFGAGIY